MHTRATPISQGLSPPATPGYYCDCRQPIAEQRAERRGAARTYCVRCGRELPLRMGRPR
jgi:predicted SprT family Zn-dependent metalloprotease